MGEGDKVPQAHLVGEDEKKGRGCVRGAYWPGAGKLSQAVGPVEEPSPGDLLRGVPKSHWEWGIQVEGLTGLGKKQVKGSRWDSRAGAETPWSLMSSWAALRGNSRQAAAASQGTLPGPAGRSPVALVVHWNEVHEEHVVGHGVHAKELHLKRGEHAPGGQRGLRSPRVGEGRAAPP